jgi:NADP-dependent 3-hydroxy acid dehydrogenase YdfG
MTHDKVALVTGAGTGIGKASAIALVKAGYSVAFAGRRLEPLQGAVKESAPSGRSVPRRLTWAIRNRWRRCLGRR